MEVSARAHEYVLYNDSRTEGDEDRTVNLMLNSQSDTLITGVKPCRSSIEKQEAQLLLGDRATRKHAKDC